MFFEEIRVRFLNEKKDKQKQSSKYKIIRK